MKKTLLTAMAVMGSAAAMAAYVDIVPAENKVYKVNEPITFNVTAWESKGKKMAAGSVVLSVQDSGAKAIGKKITVDIFAEVLQKIGLYCEKFLISRRAYNFIKFVLMFYCYIFF